MHGARASWHAHARRLAPSVPQWTQALGRRRQTPAHGTHILWRHRGGSCLVPAGCRADFRVTGDWQANAAALLYCSSDYMQRNVCNTDTLDGVFIVRQRSEADCVFNRTWGYSRDAIWVDRGCRADFEVIDRRQREWREWSRDWNDDDRRGWDRDHDRDRYREYERDRDGDRDRDDYRDRDDRPPVQ